VHVWTLRDENRFLPQDLRSGDGPRAKGDAFVEYERFFDAGVDGVFTDFPDTAVQTRSWWRSERYGRRARYERVSPDATSSSERLPPRGLDVSRSATQ